MTTAKPITEAPKRKGKAATIDNSWHRVLYRATQVERCVSCYGPMKVGMRVGVLENRSEFFGTPEPPIFYAAKVVKIQNGLATLKYEHHPYGVSLIGGVADLSKFCVPLSKRRNRKSDDDHKNDSYAETDKPMSGR